MGLILTVYMLIPNPAPTSHNNTSRTEGSPTEDNSQNINVNTQGENSSAFVVGRDFIVTPTENTPEYFLNAGDPSFGMGLMCIMSKILGHRRPLFAQPQR